MRPRTGLTGVRKHEFRTALQVAARNLVFKTDSVRALSWHLGPGPHILRWASSRAHRPRAPYGGTEFGDGTAGSVQAPERERERERERVVFQVGEKRRGNGRGMKPMLR